jgi:hypothetical protein
MALPFSPAVPLREAIGHGLFLMEERLVYIKLGKYHPCLEGPIVFVDQMLVREATSMQVNGYSGGLQRGFRTYGEVHAAWIHALSNVVGAPPHINALMSVPILPTPISV